MKGLFLCHMEIKKLYQAYLSSTTVCTDTRKIEKNCLFFALKGENFNGNTFAKQALENGAAFVVIDEKQENIDQSKTFLVSNVLECLQQLANYHRRSLNTPIIGITGSNGKTTTKELLAAVLNKKYNTYFTFGNLNNHIGVPLSILSITEKHEMAIIEMGANHQKEIEDLCKIAEPNYGLITNIGKAHLEGFGGVEGIIKGKGELYDWIKSIDGLVFVNADSDILMNMSSNLNKITYGKNNQANLEGSLESSNPHLKFAWNWSYKDATTKSTKAIESQLFGVYNYDNMLAAVCIGNYFEVDENDINYALSQYVSSNNRSQLVETKKNKLFLDAYNANPSSMKVAIESFNVIKASNKVLILGDMFELGKDSPQEHQDILNYIKSLHFKEIYLIGSNFNAFKNQFDFTFYEKRELMEDYLKKNNLAQKTILIKGSRGVALEKLVEFL